MTEISEQPEWMSLPEIPSGRFDFDLTPAPSGQAAVLSAYDRQVHRRVACKCSMDPMVFGKMSSEQIEQTLGENAKTRSVLFDAAKKGKRYNLLREARLLAMVDHPNVLPVHEVGRFEDLAIVLLLPFMDGGSAADRKFSGSWQSLLDIAIQIGRGVEALHDAGILHRDLKPSNILFDSTGRPRVSDLGFSCRMDDVSAMAECVGTLAYMPPGVEKSGFKDVRDDLWAYCMIVFEIFYGRPPFDSFAARDRGRVARVRREGGMPRSLHRIIVKGLAPNRADRWPNMRTLLAAMERVHARARRRNTMMVASVAMAASVAMGVVTTSRVAEAGACDDVMLELRPLWSPKMPEELRIVLGSRKASEAMTAYAMRWAAVRTIECDAAETEDLDTEALACTAMLRDRFQATVHAFRTAHLRSGLNYAAVISDLPAPEHCTEFPDDAEWGYGGLLELRNIDVEVDALVKMSDYDGARARQEAYMKLALELGSDYATARAIFFRAEIQRLDGSLEDAAIDYAMALERAWELGVGEFIGEILMKLTAVAGVRGDMGAVEAHALVAESALQRFRPDWLAELHQVHGLALVGGPESGRARGLTLLQQAVEMREAELRQYGGTQELLSRAHESYGKGLVAVGRSAEAIEWLERSLRVHQEEFGHGSWRTRGILREKFVALLALGRLEEAASTVEAILNIDREEGRWMRYCEDAIWLAEHYRMAGDAGGAVTVLQYGRAMAAEHHLTTVGDEIERARIEVELSDGGTSPPSAVP